jgi:hypothetical protein
MQVDQEERGSPLRAEDLRSQLFQAAAQRLQDVVVGRFECGGQGMAAMPDQQIVTAHQCSCDVDALDAAG